MDRLKYLMGLMVNCPCISSVEDCPFREFRDYPIDKLIATSYGMDLHKSNDLIEHHKKCMQKRTQMLKAG